MESLIRMIKGLPIDEVGKEYNNNYDQNNNNKINNTLMRM